MGPLQVACAKTIVPGLQDGIRSPEQLRYDLGMNGGATVGHRRQVGGEPILETARTRFPTASQAG